MSTRSQLRFTIPNWTDAIGVARLYKHADGYPSAVIHLLVEHADEPADTTCSAAEAPNKTMGTAPNSAIATDSASEPADQDTDSTPSALRDEAVLERTQEAANGAKFRQLWRGDTSGYPSQSEADMALCCLLAF